MHIKEEFERIASAVQVERDAETYLVSNATDGCNMKIRSGLLDVKVLIKEARGLEQWQPVLKVPFPLDRLVAEQVFTYLALEPPPLSRSEYGVEDFLTEVIGKDHRIAVADVSKERHQYLLDGCLAEFAAVTIKRTPRHTVAVESSEPESVFQVIEKLSIGDLPNTSYVREIKQVLGISN